MKGWSKNLGGNYVLSCKLTLDMESKEAQHTVKRHIEYWYVFVKHAMSLSSWEAIFSTLDTESENLISLFPVGHDEGRWRPNPMIAVVFHDLLYYFFSRGYWSTINHHWRWTADSLWEQALFEESLAVMTTWPLRVQLHRREYEEAKRMLEYAKSRVVSLERDMGLWEAVIMLAEAGLLRRQGNPLVAVEKLRGCVSVFEREHRVKWHAEALNRLGNTFLTLKQYDNCKQAYEETISLARSAGDCPWAREILAISQGNLGVLANCRKDHNTAVALLRECVKGLAQKTDRSIAFMELAIAHFHRDQLLKSRDFARRAKTIAETVGLCSPIADSEREWETQELPELERSLWIHLFYRSAAGRINRLVKCGKAASRCVESKPK